MKNKKSDDLKRARHKLVSANGEATSALVEVRYALDNEIDNREEIAEIIDKAIDLLTDAKVEMNCKEED